MKKYLLILLLLFSCSLKADVSIEALSHFASSWLYQYDPYDYDLQIHPYNLDSPVLGEMGVVWDLNSDGIVDLQDFSILSQIDMTQLIRDTKGLQGHFTNEYFDTLFLDIMEKEEELGIEDLRLFKILLFESDFDVDVYYYEPDWDLDFILYWETDTHIGWINIEWDFFFGTLFEYRYIYEFEAKGN